MTLLDMMSLGNNLMVSKKLGFLPDGTVTVVEVLKLTISTGRAGINDDWHQSQKSYLLAFSWFTSIIWYFMFLANNL